MLRFMTFIRPYLARLGKLQVFLGVMFCLGLASTILSFFLLFQVSRSSSGIQIVSSSPDASDLPSPTAQVFIDIGGAVHKPGIYQFLAQPRLGEVIERAGGLQINADPAFIAQEMNLSKKLSDETKIYIPFILSPDQEGAEVTVASPQLESKVSLNTASQKELEALPGIGEKRAEEIIQNRPFANIEELQTKMGLSLKIFTEIKDVLKI